MVTNDSTHMINGKPISIMTRHMDRRAFLEKTLPSWLKLQKVDSIIIVDWSSTETIMPMVSQLNDKRIWLLSVKGKQYYDPGKSFNLGVRFSESFYICNLDCDIMVSGDFLSVIDPTDENKFYVRDGKNDSHCLNGTCIFTKKMWSKINGFIEGIKSWGGIDIRFGGEDKNFYKRLEKAGFVQSRVLDEDILVHIDHDDVLREKNYEIKTDLDVLRKTIDMSIPVSLIDNISMERNTVEIFNINQGKETRLV